MADFLKKNMDAMRKAQPDMARWLDEKREPIDWAKPAEDDNILMVTGSRTKLMYSDDDKALDVKSIAVLHKENVTVFMGFGLGRLQEQTLRKMENGHAVFVVEPSAEIIRWAFERRDFSRWILNHSFFICVGEAEVSVFLPMIESRRIVEEWNMIIEPYAKERPDYMKLIVHTQQIINQLRCNTGTVMNAGAKIADNDIACLPYLIRCRGVEELRDLFKGKPAVLVSTGPSLARNIHLLREAQDKVVIVAVGQALRPLLAYDIRPDFICTVDFGEVNMSHFAGLLDSDVPLVTINRTYAPLVHAYRGPKFVCAYVEPEFKDTAYGALVGKGMIEQGGSVAHMVFGLATHLGCNPLILIGQDLALTDNKSHFNQADSSGTTYITEAGEIRWKVNDKRSTLHDGDYSMGAAQWVPGYYGEPVPTNLGLLSFLTTMEGMVKFSDRAVINATEGGARIQGAQPMFLDAALDKYCRQHVNKDAVAPLTTPVDNSDDAVKNAARLLEKDIDVLSQIKVECDKALGIADKVVKAASSPRIRELLREFDGAAAAAEKLSKGNPIITVAIYWAQRRIMQRDMLNKKNKITEQNLVRNKADLKRRITRSNIILKAARDAAESLLKTYGDSLAALRDYLDGNKKVLDAVGETAPPSLDDAAELLAAGNFAKPLLEARRLTYTDIDDGYELKRKASDTIVEAMLMRGERIKESNKIRNADKDYKKDRLPTYYNLLEESQAAGRDKDYKKALEKAEAATELFAKRKEARWGKATALVGLERFADAIAEYDDLVAEFPDDARFLLERGQTKLRNRDADGLADIGAAIEAEPRLSNALRAIANLCEKAGAVKEAREFLRIYLKNYPDDVEAREKFNSPEA